MERATRSSLLNLPATAPEDCHLHHSQDIALRQASRYATRINNILEQFTNSPSRWSSALRQTRLNLLSVYVTNSPFGGRLLCGKQDSSGRPNFAQIRHLGGRLVLRRIRLEIPSFSQFRHLAVRSVFESSDASRDIRIFHKLARFLAVLSRRGSLG